MKKLIVASLLVIGLIGVSNAESKVVYSKYGVDFLLPLTSLEAVYLYDLVEQRNLVGAETPIVSYKGIYGTMGMSTDLGADSKGIFFGGIHKPALISLLEGTVNIGLFAGRDFDVGQWVGGFKSSVKFW